MSDIKIVVYLDNGNVYEYLVDSVESGRDHAAAIIKTGYRHTPVDSQDLEWFPPHRISKVKVLGGAEGTRYRDQIRAT